MFKNFFKAIIFAMISLNCLSCSRKVLVPVERITRDTVYEIRYSTDSIYERDSILIDARRDTIIKEVHHWRERNRHQRDTIYKIKIDSVPIVTAAKGFDEKNSKERTTAYSKIIRRTKFIFKIFSTGILILMILYISRRIKRQWP